MARVLFHLPEHDRIGTQAFNAVIPDQSNDMRNLNPVV